MRHPVPVLALLGALLSAACGEGRAIFNVDLHSFLVGTGEDTIPYAVSPSSTDTVSNVPQAVNLPPGFGNSIVDSVRFTGSVTLLNTGGSGSMGFQLYLAADSAATYSSSALAIDVPTTNVSGTNSYTVPVSSDLTGTLKDLFSQSTIWMRATAVGINADPLIFVTGDGVLTALQVRVVLQEQIF